MKGFIKSWRGSLRTLNKKAIVFTLISALIAALFITMFSSQLRVDLSDKSPAANTRIKVLDSYVRNFESYSQGSMRVVAYNSLESCYLLVKDSSTFYTSEADFKNRFASCMRCGYSDCSTNITPCSNLSLKSNMDYMLLNISKIAHDNLNIETEYRIGDISIEQNYPFEVEVKMDIYYNVTDNSVNGYAFWNKHITINDSISIEGLSDPTLGIHTGGLYVRPIIATTICQNNESCWNINTTKQLYNTKSYRYYAGGTSYLSRFWDSSVASSCCGLESFVEPNAYVVINNSFIDHKYWTNTFKCPPKTTKIVQIDLVAPGFQLDEVSASRYGLSSSGVQVCGG